MRTPRILLPLLGAALGAALLTCSVTADEPKKADAPVVIIVDANGKEHKVKGWKITAGTRRLGGLAPADDKEPMPKDPPPQPPKGGKAPPKKGAVGPEALAFREDDSTTFVDGVLTLVPLDRLRELDYDKETKTVTATVATGSKKDAATVKLHGATKFQGVNRVTLEAEIDKGELGVAEVKFLGGADTGVKSIKFPEQDVALENMGKMSKITVADKMQKDPHTVYGLQALYRTADGRETVSPILMFKKTIKLDVAKINKLTSAGMEGTDLTFTVSLKDGNEETLTLMKTGKLNDKDVELVGFLGKVKAGYKLYPIHTVTSIEFAPDV